jgi:hypothetical protein
VLGKGRDGVECVHTTGFFRSKRNDVRLQKTIQLHKRKASSRALLRRFHYPGFVRLNRIVLACRYS